MFITVCCTDSGQLRLNTLVRSLLLRRTKDQISVSTGKPLVNISINHSILTYLCQEVLWSPLFVCLSVCPCFLFVC